MMRRKEARGDFDDDCDEPSDDELFQKRTYPQISPMSLTK
jgi:hypothetical protein